MTKFQKLLKDELKACKHSFRNMDLTKRTEAINYYKAESIDKRIKKSLKKDNRGQRTIAC